MDRPAINSVSTEPEAIVEPQPWHWNRAAAIDVVVEAEVEDEERSPAQCAGVADQIGVGHWALFRGLMKCSIRVSAKPPTIMLPR